ncbi:MAG: UDP-3-O-(3-hydroxymyristoyl)glucosamine N-acyltransferase [Gammaproteobacteria bacterium]|nr:MAG: UDP-3-O-(3-hydroxymyristoyl)glucosamine N-acyltransferase [Pseudomonadota bacterium]PIE39025.1 MAG: UDP-3-O-(3-hydroxymyristoyl)glucosamine N-acyltransferase [Gammaproteobacteria bacterium]
MDCSIHFTVDRLASLLGADIVVRSEKIFTGLATLKHAGSSQISFLANPAYKKYLPVSEAGAILLTPEMADFYLAEVAPEKEGGLPALLSLENPYMGYAILSREFDTNYQLTPGVHGSAIIAEDVVVPETAHIAENVVIGSGCTLGQQVSIGANSVLGNDTHLGDGTRLWHNVTCYSGVTIGRDCIVHSGTVIGSDGFGNANHNGEWVKIAQLGGVVIGNNVEIGSNCSVDRGALDNTVIADGVRIDNLVQIAHNVEIGQHTAIAGCVGIAGSTVIGSHCIIGGACGIGGHLTIADHVHMTGMTMVTKSIREPGLYSSGTGVEPNMKWRKMVARMRKLDEMAKRLKVLESKNN